MRTPMSRLLSLAILATLLLSCTALASNLLKGRARWEWSLPNSNKGGHTFTGWLSGGLTVGGEPGSAEEKRPKLGNWKAVGAGEFELHITKKDHPLHGTITVKQTQPDPKPVFEGVLLHKDGKKEKVVLKLFKD